MHSPSMLKHYYTAAYYIHLQVCRAFVNEQAMDLMCNQIGLLIRVYWISLGRTRWTDRQPITSGEPAHTTTPVTTKLHDFHELW